MKSKALKINQTTLFVYKKANQISKTETDTTSMTTTTGHTTGIFKK
jgi:hypothetical protein